MNDNIISCYTDGSADQDRLSSWAFIAVKDDKIIHQDSGVLTGDVCSIRNIGAELKSVMMAISWAKKNSYKVLIIHDLQGIEFWGTGKWKCNNKWTSGYRDYCAQNKEIIEGYQWIKSHQKVNSAHVKYNNLADELAGKTLKEYIRSNNL